LLSAITIKSSAYSNSQVEALLKLFRKKHEKLHQLSAYTYEMHHMLSYVAQHYAQWQNMTGNSTHTMTLSSYTSNV